MTTTEEHPEARIADSNAYGDTAHLIEIQGDGQGWALKIDSEDFPYFTAPEAVVPITQNGVPAVKVTLYAKHVQVDQSFPDGKHPAAWNTPRHATSPDRQEAADWAAAARNALDPDHAHSTPHGLPTLIQLHSVWWGWQMVIDGVMFPYRLGPGAIVPISTGTMPSVEITLQAQRILVDLPAVGGASTEPTPEQ